MFRMFSRSILSKDINKMSNVDKQSPPIYVAHFMLLKSFPILKTMVHTCQLSRFFFNRLVILATDVNHPTNNIIQAANGTPLSPV